MSGINSIIDTLLHQVLGQRVDALKARDLPAPVKPVLNGNAIEAFTRERGGLQQQGVSQAELASAKKMPVSPGVEVSSGKAGDNPPSASPHSSTTHLSTAARTIADVLARFPAPPSSITSPQALLQAGDASPRLLASQLQQNIQHSGVFYESHLARWLKGEWSTAALAREPQMALAPRMTGMSGLGADQVTMRSSDTRPTATRSLMAETTLPTLTSLRPAFAVNRFVNAPLLASPPAASPDLPLARGEGLSNAQGATQASVALQQVGTDQNETLQAIV
ncbi:hypothetical protein, partial [Chromohalobacter sp.]